MSYLAYRNGSLIVVKHSSLNILTDYLFVEGLIQHNVVPINNPDNFKELGLDALRILLMNLRGDSILNQGNVQDGMMRRECLRLSGLFPELEIDGFKVMLQAIWLENNGGWKNHRYNSNGNIPIKI